LICVPGHWQNLLLFPFSCELYPQCKSGIGGGSSCSNFSASQSRRSASSRVTCCAPTSSSGKTHGGLVMEKEANGTSTAVNESPVNGGGVRDVYGEDRATEDQGVTPWSVSVSRWVNEWELLWWSSIFVVCICGWMNGTPLIGF